VLVGFRDKMLGGADDDGTWEASSWEELPLRPSVLVSPDALVGSWSPVKQEQIQRGPRNRMQGLPCAYCDAGIV
jgi:hypothetical protein